MHIVEADWFIQIVLKLLQGIWLVWFTCLFLLICVCVCVCTCTHMCLATLSCSTICDPTDCRPPDSSVHGILQQEYWSGLPIPSPGDLPHPGIKPGSPALQAILYCLSHYKALLLPRKQITQTLVIKKKV